MFERPLWDEVVVGLHIAQERCLQFSRRSEACLADHLTDSAVKSLDHAVGLRVAWWAQAVLDIERFAAHVELVVPRWFTLFAGEAVGELAAIVREQLGDLHGRRLLQAIQEVHAAVLALIRIDVHEHPARGTVDGNEQVAPLALIGHLRQVLDVHVQEAWLVVPEGLERRFGLSSISKRLGLKLSQIAYTVAAQAAIQPGTRDVWVDELAHHRDQVIERQQRHASQLHSYGLLRGAQSRAQLVRAVRKIFRAVSPLPLARSRLADVVAFSNLHQRGFRLLDLRSGSGCVRAWA